MKLFVPPGRVERLSELDDPLFRRMTITRGVTLLKGFDGLYVPREGPSNEEVAAAKIAFLGGHAYLVTTSEANDLTEAGYGEWLYNPNVGLLRGYGSGLYGEGKYGVTEVPLDDVEGYGSGEYGGGIYGE